MDVASFARWVCSEIAEYMYTHVCKYIDVRNTPRVRVLSHSLTFLHTASHNKLARRYCMEILSPLGKLLQANGGLKEWIDAQHSSSLSFAGKFEDRLESEGEVKEEPLKILTARYTRLETALDVYEWLLKYD